MALTVRQGEQVGSDSCTRAAEARAGAVLHCKFYNDFIKNTLTMVENSFILHSKK
jgi:hypothetical protein